MKRKKRLYRVELSNKAKSIGRIFSLGAVLCLFGICLTLIAASMEHNNMVAVGLVMSGMGLVGVIFATRSYPDEYNKCVANSLYTTILWNEKHDAKYIIVQDGHGNIIEINNMPVKQTFQTSGRYIEKMEAEVKT